MQIHGLDTEAALASLNTTAAGLSASEAVRRTDPQDDREEVSELAGEAQQN